MSYQGFTYSTFTFYQASPNGPKVPQDFEGMEPDNKWTRLAPPIQFQHTEPSRVQSTDFAPNQAMQTSGTQHQAPPNSIPPSASAPPVQQAIALRPSGQVVGPSNPAQTGGGAMYNPFIVYQFPTPPVQQYGSGYPFPPCHCGHQAQVAWLAAPPPCACQNSPAGQPGASIGSWPASPDQTRFQPW